MGQEKKTGITQEALDLADRGYHHSDDRYGTVAERFRRLRAHSL